VDNKGLRLDYFLINKRHIQCFKDQVVHSEYEGSDHAPLEIQIDLDQIKLDDDSHNKHKLLKDLINVDRNIRLFNLFDPPKYIREE